MRLRVNFAVYDNYVNVHLILTVINQKKKNIARELAVIKLKAFSNFYINVLSFTSSGL